MSNFGRTRLARSLAPRMASDIHSFRRYFDARGRETRREESDNLFSRVSRRYCSYAASFFVYHVGIGEVAFLSSPDRGIKQDFTDEMRAR